MVTTKSDALPKSLEQDVRRAVKILREEGCSEVFLFGSGATGRVRRESDVDLAIRGCPRGQFFHLVGRLLIELDHPVDLVDLDSANPFVRQLEKEGTLVRVG